MKLFALTALCFPLTQLCKCVTIDKYVSVWVKYSCQGRRSENCILYHLCCRQTNTQVHSLQSKVGFHRRSSSNKGILPSKVIFHQSSSSIKGCLPTNVLFHQRSSFIKESSIKGSFPSKVFLKQSSPSIKGYLPSKFGDNMVKNTPNLWPTLSFFGVGLAVV